MPPKAKQGKKAKLKPVTQKVLKKLRKQAKQKQGKQSKKAQLKRIIQKAQKKLQKQGQKAVIQKLQQKPSRKVAVKPKHVHIQSPKSTITVKYWPVVQYDDGWKGELWGISWMRGDKALVGIGPEGEGVR